jgi:hypothetical protein
MLTACQSSLSDYLVAHFSATGRSSLSDIRVAPILAIQLSQRLYGRLTPSDIQVAHASL